MMFDALDLLAGVVARVFGPRIGFHGLRIDDQGAWRFFPVVYFFGLPGKARHEAVPNGRSGSNAGRLDSRT